MIEKHLFGKWQNVPLTKFHRDFSNETDTSVFENGPCAQIEHLGDCRFQRVNFSLWRACTDCTVLVIEINAPTFESREFLYFQNEGRDAYDSETKSKTVGKGEEARPQ